MFVFYLYHNNVRRRIIDFLYSLELILFYKIIKSHMNKIHEKECIRNKVIDHAHSTVLIYDNFKFSENRRNERIDETRRFKFITFVFMFEFHDRNVIFLF